MKKYITFSPTHITLSRMCYIRNTCTMNTTGNNLIQQSILLASNFIKLYFEHYTSIAHSEDCPNKGNTDPTFLYVNYMQGPLPFGVFNFNVYSTGCHAFNNICYEIVFES